MTLCYIVSVWVTVYRPPVFWITVLLHVLLCVTLCVTLCYIVCGGYSVWAYGVLDYNIAYICHYALQCVKLCALVCGVTV